MRIILIALTLPLAAQVFTSKPAAGAHYVGWVRPIYDPASQRIVTWWNDWSGSQTIYANSAWTFRTSDGAYTKIGSSNSGQGTYTASDTTITRASGKTFETSWVGSNIVISSTRYTIASVSSGDSLTIASGSPPASGSWIVACPESTSTWFGDRHLYGKVAFDNRRNRIYQVGGACSDGAGQNHPDNTWFLHTAPLPSGIRYFQSGAPDMGTGSGGAGMEYSPAQDVMWLFYGGAAYIYCPTDTGTLTGAQTTYGCTAADQWTNKTSTNLNANGGSCSSSPYCPWSHPSSAVQFGSKLVRREEVFYWFNTAATGTNEGPVIIWTFNVATKRWTLLTTTGTPNANNSTQSRTALYDYDPINDLFWYYLPGDKHIYTFDPDTLAFTDRGAFSSLPSKSELSVYDPSQHSFIVWDGDESSGNAGTAWVGKLPYTFSVDVTVQESLYPADFTGTTASTPAGLARTSEAFCTGVPLKEIWNVTDVQTLGLSGASAGQFRALAWWPSGSVKWVEVLRHPVVALGWLDGYGNAFKRRVGQLRRIESRDRRHAGRGLNQRRHLRRGLGHLL